MKINFHSSLLHNYSTNKKTGNCGGFPALYKLIVWYCVRAHWRAAKTAVTRFTFVVVAAADFANRFAWRASGDFFECWLRAREQPVHGNEEQHNAAKNNYAAHTNGTHYHK